MLSVDMCPHLETGSVAVGLGKAEDLGHLRPKSPARSERAVTVTTAILGKVRGHCNTPAACTQRDGGS